MAVDVSQYRVGRQGRKRTRLRDSILTPSCTSSLSAKLRRALADQLSAYTDVEQTCVSLLRAPTPARTVADAISLLPLYPTSLSPPRCPTSVTSSMTTPASAQDARKADPEPVRPVSLPDELWTTIFEHLNFHDLRRVEMVCKRFQNLLKVQRLCTMSL